MISFANDYSEGCHERVLQRLVETNREQSCGYGMDPHCFEAARRIRHCLGRDDLDVHFIVGGTQTNLLAIASLLRPHEGVIAAASGHINVHESGAIEASGHKVLALPTADGKLRPDAIRTLYHAHYDDATHEHMVKPGMIYISNTTEVGTVYSKEELTELYACARSLKLPLYIDGARFASALAADNGGLSMEDMPSLCDAFSIGGTKNGLLFGEALVLVLDRWKEEFRYIQKQKGAMLAKGRLLGLQFEEVFRNDLYLEMGRHSNRMAFHLRDGLTKLGARFAWKAESNQIFVYLRDESIRQLSEEFEFEVTPQVEGDSIVRFCTSWATPEASVDALLTAAGALKQPL